MQQMQAEQEIRSQQKAKRGSGLRRPRGDDVPPVPAIPAIPEVPE
jgi:hypothetical protein